MAVVKYERESCGLIKLTLRDGGRFVAYSGSAPKSVTAGGMALPFEYAGGRLEVNVPVTGGCVEIEIVS